MSALTHAQAREWIEQAADGLLSPAQQATLAAHLATCAECRAYADELKQLENEITNALHAHFGQPSLSKIAQRNILDKSRRGSGGNPPPYWLALPLILLLAFIAWLLFGNHPVAAIAAPTASATQVPSATLRAIVASATFTPTPTQLLLTAIPTQTANCREGNSNQFEIADTLLAGKKYGPVARGNDNLWVVFIGPTYGHACWVYIDNLKLFINDEPVEIGDIPESLLPFVPYPPTPTPSPTVTFTPEPSESFVPECRDGIDNDRDRRIDFPSDTSCTSANDNDESK